MLGYVCIDTLGQKPSITKYGLRVKKINNDSKGINIQLHKRFDISKEKDVKKIIKVFKKEKIDKLVFQKDVFKRYKAIVDTAYTNDMNIITGNMLYSNMATNIMEYIFNLTENIKLEQIHLGIAMDLISYNKLEFIKQMADTVRGITILTSVPSKYENLCKEILNEYGLVIKCTDNFKSGLKDCDVCVNFDIDNSNVVVSIPNKCIFINLNSEINKIKKSFKGIIINDICIDISDIVVVYEDFNFSDYRPLAIAQAYDMENIQRKIVSCIGLNGNIDEDEFKKYKIYKGKK